MNFLKIKLGVFSLLAVLAVSVFLTACEQGEILGTLKEQSFEVVESNIFIISTEFEGLTEGQQIDFLEELSQEELTDLTTQNAVTITERSCGNWALWATYCSSHVGYKNYIYRRWCGPPSNGGYQYYVHSQYNQGC